MQNNPLPQELFLAEQVLEMERHAIEHCFIPGITLMENAGLATWNLLQRAWPKAGRITVVCGPGNNGGDGYVVARLAKESGLNVTLHSSCEPDTLKGDAATVCDRWLDSGGRISRAEELKPADVIVDALLGTGLDRPVGGVIADMIDSINAMGCPVLALDIPSGLNADNGTVMGAAVKADVTISLIGLKQGLFTNDGPDFCGNIVYDSIGVPDEVSHSQTPSAYLHQPDTPLLPRRPRNSHKGQFGHALLIGGDNGFTGAIGLAGEACLRAGTGLVSIASRAGHANLLNISRPELMCHGVEDRQSLVSLMQNSTVVAIGTGLGQSRWAGEMLSAVLESRLPLILDADALNLLAQDPTLRDNWVLTPHPGEAARLLGCSTEEIQQDRFTAVRNLHDKYGGVILLKGAGTLVYDGKTITVNATGNPGMASGGMGDTLTGVIAALLAQGMSPAIAARTGAWLHGAAGDEAARSGEIGLLASDLMPHIRGLLNATSDIDE